MLKSGPACSNGSRQRSPSDVLGRYRSQKRRQTLYQAKGEKIIFLLKTERTNTDFACLGSRALPPLRSDKLRFHHLQSIFLQTNLRPHHLHRPLRLAAPYQSPHAPHSKASFCRGCKLPHILTLFSAKKISSRASFTAFAVYPYPRLLCAFFRTSAYHSDSP